MRSKSLTIVLILGACLLNLTSCLKQSKSSYTVSDDASISYFYLKQNDSIEGLEDAVFTINNAPDPSLIYNEDSLPCGTRVDSVYPSITFTASSVASIRLDFKHNGSDTTVYYTGSEPIDFTEPVTATILSSDMTKTKVYEIKVNVHKVVPELFSWQEICQDIYTDHDASMQQVVLYRDTLYLLTNDGSQTRAYQSADGNLWHAVNTSGLPTYADVSSLKVFNDKLYFISEGKLYKSADGRVWTASTTMLTNLLFVLPVNGSTIRQLWGITENQLYSTQDGQNWTLQGSLPSGFPQQQYASCVHQGYTKQWTAIVMGGYDKNNQMLDCRWVTEDGVNWFDMTPTLAFQQNAGGTLVCYDHQLLLFGAVDKDQNPMTTPCYVSTDDGLNWSEADTTYNRLVLDNGYVIRGYTRASLSKDGYDIFLIGGRTRTTLYKDVWKGRKNDITWN